MIKNIFYYIFSFLFLNLVVLLFKFFYIVSIEIQTVQFRELHSIIMHKLKKHKEREKKELELKLLKLQIKKLENEK